MSIILIGNAEAGSNGDAPQEGQDWIINQDTHVWDEEVSVKNILINFGKTLKLENVTLDSVGFIEIRGDTEWLNSSILHDKKLPEDNISLYSKLEIVNSKLSMNATDAYDGNNPNVFYVSKEAELIVRDFDNDETTAEDRSIIKGLNTHVGGVDERNNHSIVIGHCVRVACSYDQLAPDLWYDAARFSIKNSYFENAYAIRFFGKGGEIKNKGFNNQNCSYN